MTNDKSRFISIRQLVAGDITLHGTRFILIEFGLGTPVLLFFGFWLMLSNFIFAVGFYIFLIGINYSVLLLYAIVIVRKGSSRSEASDEIVHSKQYLRQFGIQQFLILVPLAIVVLASVQEERK